MSDAGPPPRRLVVDQAVGDVDGLTLAVAIEVGADVEEAAVVHLGLAGEFDLGAEEVEGLGGGCVVHVLKVAHACAAVQDIQYRIDIGRSISEDGAGVDIRWGRAGPLMRGVLLAGRSVPHLPPSTSREPYPLPLGPLMSPYALQPLLLGSLMGEPVQERSAVLLVVLLREVPDALLSDVLLGGLWFCGWLSLLWGLAG